MIVPDSISSLVELMAVNVTHLGRVMPAWRRASSRSRRYSHASGTRAVVRLGGALGMLGFGALTAMQPHPDRAYRLVGGSN